MLRRRPKNILALYVESRRLEIIRAKRQWRTWQLGPVEQYPLPDGEALFDQLQRLNLRPKAGHATALILFLPRSHYAFGRELYPLALQDRLEESLTFDWPENLFYDAEQTLRFTAPPVIGEQQLIVPIFSLPQETYDKFQEALAASHFNSFTIIPSALAYRSFVTELTQANGHPSTRIFARVLGPSQLEVHRYFNGTIIDSFMVRREHVTQQLFLETLKVLTVPNEPDSDESPHLDLVCTTAEATDTATSYWLSNGLPISPRTIEGSMLTQWMEYLVDQDQLKAFGATLRLKPWQPPRIIFPLLLVAALYGAFASYQWYSSKDLNKTFLDVQTQRKHLEAQWKPIEQLQTNISRLKEQQKALAEFDQQSYPVYELFDLLTQITPDDTWLDFFSLTNKELQIRGESKSAAKYLSELSKVEGFSNVSFASPVSRNPASDKERFNVRIQMDVDKLRKILAGKALESGDKTEEEGDNLGPPADTIAPQGTAPAVDTPKALGPSKDAETVEKGRVSPSRQGSRGADEADDDSTDDEEDNPDEGEEVTQ